MHRPEAILGPFVTPGMTVLDVGPAMGFFTLPLARMVGAGGRVVCVDVQEAMLRSLGRRARAAGLAERLVPRACSATSLSIDDFDGQIDFALAFAVVHEIPDVPTFWGNVARALKPGTACLIAEPRGHVSAQAFAQTLDVARQHSLRNVAVPRIVWCHAAVLRKG